MNMLEEKDIDREELRKEFYKGSIKWCRWFHWPCFKIRSKMITSRASKYRNIQIAINRDSGKELTDDEKLYQSFEAKKGLQDRIIGWLVEVAGKYGAIGLTATADVVFNLLFLRELLDYSNKNKEIVGPKIVIAVLFIQICSTFVLNFSC